LEFNPHIHVVVADGYFALDGSFKEAWAYDTAALKDAFMSAVFKLLLDRGMSESRIELILSWQHSGFSIYRGSQIPAYDREGLERLAGYIVRCPFAASRLSSTI